MVYYKLVLNDKRTNQNEIYPIVVRVTYNRNNTTINTGIRVKVNEWDSLTQLIKRDHPNHLTLNLSLSTFYLKVQKAIHGLLDKEVFSFEALQLRLQDKPELVKQVPIQSFNHYSRTLVNHLLEGNKSGNAIVYRTASNKLIDFGGGKEIPFKDIDYTFLESFVLSLIRRGLKQNSISNYMRTIRAIYNRAIKAKIIDKSLYPFDNVTIKSERTVKRAVLISDFKRLQSTDIMINSNTWHARNHFFLSFSLIGMSFTDLAYLKPSNITQGRVSYRRKKTHKEYDIKLTPLAISILELYKTKQSAYLLPVLNDSIPEDSLQAKKVISQWIKTTNKWLKRLGEQCEIDLLTTYVARHTWATTAKRMGYSNELIAEAMGHEYGNKITNIYLDNFEQSVIDDLNEKVQSTL